MREIEYRAFVKETKKMLPVTDLCFNETESVGVSGCGDANCTLCVDWYNFDDVLLMQYTER
ncbi:YopX family protein, partial [Listeria monocytogenes]